MIETGYLIDDVAKCQEIAAHMRGYFMASDKVRMYKRLRKLIIQTWRSHDMGDCDCLDSGHTMNEVGDPCIMSNDEFYDSPYSKGWCIFHRSLHKIHRAIKYYSRQGMKARLIVRGKLRA